MLKFVRMVVNSVVLMFAANTEFAGKRQAHKHFRLQLAHELVEPLLNKKRLLSCMV